MYFLHVSIHPEKFHTINPSMYILPTHVILQKIFMFFFLFLGLCENCNMCLFFCLFFIPRNKGILFRKPFMLIIIILAIIPCIYWEHLLFHYFFVNKITLSRAFFFWSVGSKKKGNQFRKGECARERKRATYLVDRVEWMNEWVEMEMMHK